MSTADDDAFDAAITVRANAYARGVADAVMEQANASLVTIARTAEVSEEWAFIRALVVGAVARAFVVGLAAGIEAERGPVSRRPPRRRARR